MDENNHTNLSNIVQQEEHVKSNKNDARIDVSYTFLMMHG